MIIKFLDDNKEIKKQTKEKEDIILIFDKIFKMIEDFKKDKNPLHYEVIFNYINRFQSKYDIKEEKLTFIKDYLNFINNKIINEYDF